MEAWSAASTPRATKGYSVSDDSLNFMNMNPEQLAKWEEESAKYFTCQCNPPFESVREEGSFWAHRVPIDCMTAEDWKRVAEARQERAVQVWVVESNGDSDCGGTNDGVLGVYEHKSDAWTRAFSEAQQYINNRDWDKDPEYNVTEEGIELYASSINVKEMNVH